MPIPGYARIALTLCALIITITGFIPPAHASEEGDARMDAIKAHLGDIVIVMADSKLEFEAAGPRLPMEELPGGDVLGTAAYYYSLVTGDFSVSLGELMDNGFWPYNIYDAKYREFYVYDLSFERGPILSAQPRDEAWLAELTKDTSRYAARREILRYFYSEYLVDNWDDVDAAVAALQPVEAFWQIDSLLDEEGQPIGGIEDGLVWRFMDQGYNYSSYPSKDPYNGLTVPLFAWGDCRWPLESSTTTYVNTNAGYDSQYRENTRRSPYSDAPAQTPAEPAEPKIGVVPPAQPAPDGARRPGAVTG